MANLNKFLVIGRLTRDPELRHIQSSGTAVCEFGIAVNREWTSQGGEKQSEVMFMECTAWARRGEVMAEYLEKGSPVFIEGHIKFEEWVDRETNAKRSKHKLVVDNFQFIDSKRNDNGGGQQGGGQRGGGGQRQDDRPADREEQGDGPGPPSTDFALEEDVPF